MVKLIVSIVLIALWLLILYVMDKAELDFWKFILGSSGLFIILIVLVRPYLVEPMARIVALIACVPGYMTGFFMAHYKYGVIFVQSLEGAISLKIDFECSGVIEIFAFVALIAFYKVYEPAERIVVGLIGVLGIILANAIRLVVICFMIHYMGTDCYFLAHTYVGRIVFYTLSVILYFYAFTKPQIVKQKVGSFNYDAD